MNLKWQIVLAVLLKEEENIKHLPIIHAPYKANDMSTESFCFPYFLSERGFENGSGTRPKNKR